MKKLFVATAIFATGFVHNIFAQPASTLQEESLNPSHLLVLYYNIKDALVAGDANTASLKAGEFVKTLNGFTEKSISVVNRDALLKDASQISSTKDIKLQREQFADFSAGMIALAKSTKLSDKEIYVDYCPMKKSYWLSAEKPIKNPYYGNTMLTCGSVIETIKQ